MKHLRNNREYGFTVTELVVVIIFIGMLTAIVIPVIMWQRGSIRDKITESNMDKVVGVVETYLANSDNNPADITTQRFEKVVQVQTSSDFVWGVAYDEASEGYCIAAYSELSRSYEDSEEALTYDSVGGGLNMAATGQKTSANACAENGSNVTFSPGVITVK